MEGRKNSSIELKEAGNDPPYSLMQRCQSRQRVTLVRDWKWSSGWNSINED